MSEDKVQKRLSQGGRQSDSNVLHSVKRYKFHTLFSQGGSNSRSSDIKMCLMHTAPVETLLSASSSYVKHV